MSLTALTQIIHKDSVSIVGAIGPTAFVRLFFVTHFCLRYKNMSLMTNCHSSQVVVRCSSDFKTSESSGDEEIIESAIEIVETKMIARAMHFD